MARKPGPERVRGRTGRRVGTREVRQRFLIVCEGEQTEPISQGVTTPSALGGESVVPTRRTARRCMSC